MLQIDNSGVMVWVTRLDKRTVDKLRHAYRVKGCSLSVGTDYDTHHIIPLSLSGDNGRDNLVLMERNDHAYLHHEFLDPQTKDLRAGMSGWLVIPTSYDLDSIAFKKYEQLIDDLLNEHTITYKVREI